MQMAKLGWRKHTHPHTEGHMSLKQSWTQREGVVPGGSVRGEPSCCPGSRSHLPPRPQIQRGRKGKKAKQEKEEGKQECLNLSSVTEDFLLLYHFFPRQVNLLAGVLHKKKSQIQKNTPNSFPLSPVTKSARLCLWNCGKWSWCQKLL